METNGKSVQLKLFLDKKKKKVMFAEADEDFVDILFSFFTLPLGTIAILSNKNAVSKDIKKVGSLTSLHESVLNLNENLFTNSGCKEALLNPVSSSASVCHKLKVNLNDEKKPNGFQRDSVFVKSKTNFIITDDLNVVPVMLDTSITLLHSLGVEYNHLLDEISMPFRSKEFSDLLNWSLVSNNPLTNMVFGGSRPSSCPSPITNSTLSNSALISETQNVKLLVQKSIKKVICAEVENRFVELLFTFLTLPLGACERLTKDTSFPVGISNLYNSISSLGEGKYLKSEDVKTMLLCPKLAPNYLRVTNLLPIYEENTHPGRFIREHATFIVSDDLKVSTSPSIATISKFNTPGVPVSDMEILQVSIGEQEALLLLKASLTSTSALTDFLNAFQENPKNHVPNTFVDGGRDSGEEEAGFTFVEENDIDEPFVMVY